MEIMNIEDEGEFYKRIVTINIPKELIEFIKTNKFEFHNRFDQKIPKYTIKEVIEWIEKNDYKIDYKIMLKKSRSIISDMLCEVSNVIAYDSRYDELDGRYNICNNIICIQNLIERFF